MKLSRDKVADVLFKLANGKVHSTVIWAFTDLLMQTDRVLAPAEAQPVMHCRNCDMTTDPTCGLCGAELVFTAKPPIPADGPCSVCGDSDGRGYCPKHNPTGVGAPAASSTAQADWDDQHGYYRTATNNGQPPERPASVGTMQDGLRVHDAAHLCEDEGCPQHGTDHVCVEKPTFTETQVREAVGKAAAEVWRWGYVPPFVTRVMCILAELEAERKEPQ